MIQADIDIDIKPGLERSEFGIRAIQYDSEKKAIRVHPSGIYVNEGMPIDPETGFASIDYEEAEARGFIKVDLLNNSVYSRFNSKEEVLDCLNREPDWDKLKDYNFVVTLPHIGRHYDLVAKIVPKSLDDLADILALIRPGKQHLVESYLKNKEQTRKNLYRRSTTGMWFRKSHAFAYAAMIVVVMNKC